MTATVLRTSGLPQVVVPPSARSVSPWRRLSRLRPRSSFFAAAAKVAEIRRQQSSADVEADLTKLPPSTRTDPVRKFCRTTGESVPKPGRAAVMGSRHHRNLKLTRRRIRFTSLPRKQRDGGLRRGVHIIEVEGDTEAVEKLMTAGRHQFRYIAKRLLDDHAEKAERAAQPYLDKGYTILAEEP